MENWVMGCVPGGSDVSMVSTCAGMLAAALCQLC